MDDVDRLEEKAALGDASAAPDPIDAFEVLRRKDGDRNKLVAGDCVAKWIALGWTKVGEDGGNVRISWTAEGEPRRPARRTVDFVQAEDWATDMKGRDVERERNRMRRRR